MPLPGAPRPVRVPGWLPAVAALLVLAPAAPASGAGWGPLDAHGRPVLDARVRYLLAHPQAAGGTLPLTIRFAAPPDAAALAAAAQAGARFHAHEPAAGAAPSRAARAFGVARVDGRTVLGARTVFPVDAAPADVAALAALPGVARIETSWSPQPPQLPLYRTRALIGAEAVWALHDPQGGPVLGTGVTIGDLDSGTDVFHPDFWRDDGPAHAWFDLDASGTLTDGDAADLNDDGHVDAGETVRWLDAPGTAPGQAGTMNPTIDHVYVDANANGVRDWGPGLFTEAQPTYGELVLRPRDLDLSGTITPGEPLVELKTCKVRAVYQTDGVVRRAGTDLILGEGDVYGHGTNVTSILLGGEPGRRFAGIAPGASLVMADLAYGADPPFVSPMDVRLAWCVAEGADLTIVEDGEWIWLFLDGSSNVEQLIDQYAAAGVTQVMAAGNLATGNMHWQGALGTATGDSAVAVLHVDGAANVTRGWGQLYWVPRAGDGVAIDLVAPTGERFAIGGAGTTTSLAQFDVWHATDVSPRGTVRVDYELALAAGAALPNLSGDWRFVARRTGAPVATPLVLNAMSWDELSGWTGYSTWTVPALPGTVTWPSTADSAIVVAAYDPATGNLNSFSGRGPRVDGTPILDVTAPGSTTWTGRRRQNSGNVPGGYGSFGGTSAALPHVAGSVALLRQWLPNASQGEIRAMLRAGATVDAQTGAVPNGDWGWGKVNVYQALLLGTADVGPVAERAGLAPALGAAAPNPFGAATRLAYTLPAAGEVSVEIFDLAGRTVARLARGREEAGTHALTWNGRAANGARAPAGVYLVQVRLDGHAASRKVVRVE